MNLDAAPSKEQLRQLIAQGNDRAGHHILWVTKKGDVHLTLVPTDPTPAAFAQVHPEVQLRYETFQKGNEYVGPEAAADEEWLAQLFDHLLHEWRQAKGKQQPVYVELW